VPCFGNTFHPNSDDTDLQKLPKVVKPSGQFERFARIPRNQLLDALFGLFAQQTHWSIKELRLKTQQPEAYLKEVLSEVASLHRTGEKVGLWTLKENFVREPSSGVKGEEGNQYSSDVGAKDEEMEDDLSEDDEEMEEVS
jgi:transcription initiation factor TFIIF subunit beta